MRHLTIILLLLTLTTTLTFSETPVKLGGPEGLSILDSMANSTMNQTNDTLNQTNTSLNQTNMSLIQANDSLNAANQTIGMTGIKTTSSSSLWSWGNRPKDHSVKYNNSANSATTSPPNPLDMTSDLKDLNDLAEKNNFATAP